MLHLKHTQEHAELYIITDDPSNYKQLQIPEENIIHIEKNENYNGLLANIIIQMLSYELGLFILDIIQIFLET